MSIPLKYLFMWSFNKSKQIHYLGTLTLKVWIRMHAMLQKLSRLRHGSIVNQTMWTIVIVHLTNNWNLKKKILFLYYNEKNILTVRTIKEWAKGGGGHYQQYSKLFWLITDNNELKRDKRDTSKRIIKISRVQDKSSMFYYNPL